jgi:PhoH-like ATPase
VLSELDRFKNEMTERGANAREVHRALMKTFAAPEASVTEGVRTMAAATCASWSTIRKMATDLASVLEFQRIFPGQEKMDHRILACTLWLREQLDTPVILVSKDLNMQLKARAMGLECEDYLHDKVEPRDVANFDIARVAVSGTSCSASPAAVARPSAGAAGRPGRQRLRPAVAGDKASMPAKMNAQGELRRLHHTPGGHQGGPGPRHQADEPRPDLPARRPARPRDQPGHLLRPGRHRQDPARRRRRPFPGLWPHLSRRHHQPTHCGHGPDRRFPARHPAGKDAPLAAAGV